MFAFERFPVYKLAENFFTEIQDVTKSREVSTSLKDQLLRASSSILLNIAEGAGKHSPKDKKNFYAISRGSVQECVAILRILKIQALITETEFNYHYGQLTILSKMLSGLINKMLQV